jgi:cell division protein FtsL
MTVAIVATVAALLALVLTNVMLGQAGFRVAELRSRIAEKSVDVEQLELEVQKMRAPTWLAKKARELGMVPATEVTVIAPDRMKQGSVRRGTTSNVRGPSPAMGRE